MVEIQHFQSVEVASFQKSKNDSPWCGDAYYCMEEEGTFICAVSDGLGSGEIAHQASILVMSYISAHSYQDVSQLMTNCNELLVNKRGVVLTILKINLVTKKMYYSTIGNITCLLITDNQQLQRTIPKRGFLSGKKQTFSTEQLSFEKQFRFLIYTDGIELQTSLLKKIVYEKNIIEILHYVKEKETLKNDDLTFLIGDIVTK